MLPCPLGTGSLVRALGLALSTFTVPCPCPALTSRLLRSVLQVEIFKILFSCDTLGRSCAGVLQSALVVFLHSPVTSWSLKPVNILRAFRNMSQMPAERSVFEMLRPVSALDRGDGVPPGPSACISWKGTD